MEEGESHFLGILGQGCYKEFVRNLVEEIERHVEASFVEPVL